MKRTEKKCAHVRQNLREHARTWPICSHSSHRQMGRVSNETAEAAARRVSSSSSKTCGAKP
eukprot:524490-Pleurochrysis_carterae.AAC.1